MGITNDLDKNNNGLGNKEYPVQKFAIKGDKVTKEEVEESVQELNVDEDTTDRG